MLTRDWLTGALRAVSLWQPWAQAIVLGLKKWETRTWVPHFGLGWVAIHAAAVSPRKALGWKLPEYERVLAAAGWTSPLDHLPRGAIVAVAYVAAYERTEAARPHLSAQEAFWGDYTPGRWAWSLTQVHPLRVPLRLRGQQSIWTLEPAEVDGVLANL